MNEKSHQTLLSPGNSSRLLWLFGKQSQYGAPVEKEKRIGWMKMPFFSKTVEGSVLTVVQDIRSGADEFLFPARPPSPRLCVYLEEVCSCWRTGVLNAADVIRLETQVLH